MEDTARSAHYNGKAGSCARDLVSECRKCSNVVCRVGLVPTAKIYPQSVVDGTPRLINLVVYRTVRSSPHLLQSCARGTVAFVLPAKGHPSVASFSQRKARMPSCFPRQCRGQYARAPQTRASGSVSPVGEASGGPTPNIAGTSSTPPPHRTGASLSEGIHRLIRPFCGAHRIWRWRTQYGEVLGGLGTGIGDADRGVECARGKNCLSSKYIEHETDCDAEDAREAEDLALVQSRTGTPTLSLYSGSHSWSSSHSSLHSHSNASTPNGLLGPVLAAASAPRSPSPAVGPGYARHEVEGIGNKIKTIKMSMVRVGGCVPEWKDEKASGQALGREIAGDVRSWCGWCHRVIPGKKDYLADEQRRSSTSTTSTLGSLA